MKLMRGKLAVVYAVLKRAGKPLSMAQLQPRVENRLKQVVGKSRLHRLLQTARSMGYPFVIEGRGDQATYGVVK